MPNRVAQCNAAGWTPGRCWAAGRLGCSSIRGSGVFLVALEQFDRDALRAADEADPYTRADGLRLARELDTLGLDLGRDSVDVLYRQTKVVEALIGRDWRRVDAVAGLDLGDEYIGSAEFDVDASRATNDGAAEHILEPSRGRLRIGAAQMDVIPGDD